MAGPSCDRIDVFVDARVGLWGRLVEKQTVCLQRPPHTTRSADQRKAVATTLRCEFAVFDIKRGAGSTMMERCEAISPPSSGKTGSSVSFSNILEEKDVSWLGANLASGPSGGLGCAEQHRRSGSCRA